MMSIKNTRNKRKKLNQPKKMTTKTHGITGELILYTTMHSGQAGCCDLTVGSSVSSLQC
jgi:hypothetical protein